jgi:hypothetical protein
VIREPRIDVRANLVLVPTDLIKSGRLAGGERINAVLLKQAASVEEGRELKATDVQVELVELALLEAGLLSSSVTLPQPHLIVPLVIATGE